MDNFFEEFRKNTIGYKQKYITPYGNKELIYADWTASGRLYSPIEERISCALGPFVGNTHSESNKTGSDMSYAYNLAHEIIKKHVNADINDIIITCGFGTTSAISKLQSILGLKINEKLRNYVNIPIELKPVVFVTHMEHHSNHISWLETYCDVVCIKPTDEGLIDLVNLEENLKIFSSRKIKIGSFTACSNVTGIQTPYFQMAKLMHKYNGICFIDFAASAPYVKIDMHPIDKMEQLDAIFFSAHKFLGGPGSSGVLVFNSSLYNNHIPDVPGGGTVNWTNPWGGVGYISNIEVREDGGTPGFLQAIKAALSINLKEKMTTEKLLKRDKQIAKKVIERLCNIKKLHILAGNIKERLAICSFYVENIHYNLVVKILDERFGIQVRGGCSCAGTYGHYLLFINEEKSKTITDEIDRGDFSEKPGWIRLSIHPMTTDAEIDYILDSIENTVQNIEIWKEDYRYNSKINEFININKAEEQSKIKEWFIL